MIVALIIWILLLIHLHIVTVRPILIFSHLPVCITLLIVWNVRLIPTISTVTSYIVILGILRRQRIINWASLYMLIVILLELLIRCILIIILSLICPLILLKHIGIHLILLVLLNHWLLLLINHRLLLLLLGHSIAWLNLSVIHNLRWLLLLEPQLLGHHGQCCVWYDCILMLLKSQLLWIHLI